MLIIAAMWWFKRQPEKPMREQLLDARATLIAQIETLERGPVRSLPTEWQSMQAQAAELRVVLAEIESRTGRWLHFWSGRRNWRGISGPICRFRALAKSWRAAT